MKFICNNLAGHLTEHFKTCEECRAAINDIPNAAQNIFPFAGIMIKKFLNGKTALEKLDEYLKGDQSNVKS